MISNEKKGSASFKIKTQCQHYLLVVNAFTPTEEPIHIALELFDSAVASTEPMLSIKSALKDKEITYKQ